MKILILSLLRLGDIVLHGELVKSLKAQYPDAQIDLLINSQFRAVKDLLPEVSNWHLCPRQQIQQILVEKKQSPLSAHALMKEMVVKLNAEKYDLILNATHNRFSVRLMDVLKAKQKRGAALENGRKVADQNRWQTYFNEHFSELKGSRFHYLEVLQRSLGIEPLRKPNTDLAEGEMILLQVLTSDAKKNWGLSKFRQLMDKLKSEFPSKKVYAVCSPFEQDEVLKHFGEHEVLAPLLKELPELLKKTALLITGDTSIQHVAASLKRPLLSLFLGSADPIKTGPWMSGYLVLQGSAECSPCSHSSACSQFSHLCGDSLGVSKVFTAAQQILRKESPMQQNMNLRNDFEVTLWSHYLDQDSADLVHIPEAWNAIVPSLKQEFTRYEIAVSKLQTLISNMSSSLLTNTESNFALHLTAAQSLVNDMQRSFPQMRDSFALLRRALLENSESHFSQFKKIKSAWIELETLTEIRKQVLRKMKFETQASMEVLDV